MKYSLLVSTLYYICGCFYMIFGAYAVASNAKSRNNRLFLLTTSSLAIWSFTYSISSSAPTAEASAFWSCMSVFGWGFFHSFFLHFALIMTKTKSRLNKRIMLIILYLPTFINVVLFAPFGFLAVEKQYQMVQTDFGWVNILPINMGGIWFIAYYSVFSITSIILLIRWWIKIKSHTPLKRQATYFLISILLPFFLGIATETLPNIIGITVFPQMVIVFMIVSVATLFLALRKFGILFKRTRTEFLPLDSDILSEESRLRLFETAASIFTIGAVGSFFVGYFIAGENLANELLLSSVVLILGIFLRFIPLISKKHTVQDTLFLIASIVGMTFFIINDINKGAITVWAVYTIFLLCTVILNSNIHTFLFLGATLITQVVVSIIHPRVFVVINSAQYLKRIFIIILSYFAVRYLTSEYSSKLRGYKRFTKEQEMLEKISTIFISVNTENAKEKVDEMFGMIAKMLNFDNAYLFELDAGYEIATILNMYVKDIESKSPPFYPGTKFKTADFPEVKPLIAQNLPILCEDASNISVEKAGNQRNFFISRGINSFFALPITVDKKTDGFFVIEYRDRSDKRFTESRLYFLKIIANILGDARKKILYEERIYNIAYFDETTKLANRNMLKKNLEQILHVRKESEKIVIFDVELGNLRMINDTFGHRIGEQVVIESAAILKSLMKEECSISRIAEGKFIIIMPAAENAEQIQECAEKIVDAFSNPVLPKEGREALFVTVVIGISIYPDDGKDVNTLLQNADLAAYEARSNNENIVFYTKRLESNIAENTLFTNKLFKSLQNKEFFLEFQPQISCDTGKTVGIEALLRWTSDGNKRIPPDRFIPILEQTGLIYDVGLWVLEQALQEHNRLAAKGFPSLRVSVNLSVVQFRNENIVSDISKRIEKSRVNPKYIELEITESMFSKNPVEVLKKLHELKKLGISIAIDDFGRGYSSLNRLKLIPFDRIKIDKDIIDYIDLERKLAPLTEIIILLARAFKAGVTAEGVETKEQADFLRSISCDEIQGYHFSRPLSPEALEEFLKKNDQ
jgi:diguanylate cyclase (GGDEF)-like protein